MVRIIFLIFFSMHVYAEEIENDVVKERRCEQAKDNLETLRERMLSGYSVKESNYLNEKERELVREVRIYCY